ncbi:MAG: hypothetical protein R2685_12770 [Candidatus Nitrosocosmicus sp.]|nr:hypothetical protein [Candidatus Nitrosocosmicus sp.]
MVIEIHLTGICNSYVIMLSEHKSVFLNQLLTPNGRQVFIALTNEFGQTNDVFKSIEKSLERAKELNIDNILLFALLQDLFVFGSPILLQLMHKINSENRTLN